jgi:hypothetical protein
VDERDYFCRAIVEFRLPAVGAADDGISLLTGDLATRSDDGYFRLVGRRSSDLIKTAGFKVGPARSKPLSSNTKPSSRPPYLVYPIESTASGSSRGASCGAAHRSPLRHSPTTPPRVWSATSVRGRSRS